MHRLASWLVVAAALAAASATAQTSSSSAGGGSTTTGVASTTGLPGSTTGVAPTTGLPGSTTGVAPPPPPPAPAPPSTFRCMTAPTADRCVEGVAGGSVARKCRSRSGRRLADNLIDGRIDNAWYSHLYDDNTNDVGVMLSFEEFSQVASIRLWTDDITPCGDPGAVTLEGIVADSLNEAQNAPAAAWTLLYDGPSLMPAEREAASPWINVTQTSSHFNVFRLYAKRSSVSCPERSLPQAEIGELEVECTSVVTNNDADDRTPIHLGGWCYPSTTSDSTRFTVDHPVRYIWQDSSNSESRCRNDTVVPSEAEEGRPLSSLNGFNASAIPPAFVLRAWDQYDSTWISPALTEICLQPNAGSVKQCFPFNENVDQLDNDFFEFSLDAGLINGVFSDPIVEVEMSPQTGETEAQPGQIQYWLGVVPTVDDSVLEFLPAGFGLVVYGDAVVSGGDVGPRLAVGGNFQATTSLSVGASVCAGSDLTASPAEMRAQPCLGPRPFSLLVNGDATWAAGGLFPRDGAPGSCGTNVNWTQECAAIVGNVLGSPSTTSPLVTQRCDLAVTGPCSGGSGCATPAFERHREGVQRIVNQQFTWNADSGVTVTSRWNGIILDCSDPTALLYHVRIPRDEFNAASWFSTTASCNPIAGWRVALTNWTGPDDSDNSNSTTTAAEPVIDDATAVVFSGGSFPAAASHTRFLIAGTAPVTVASMDVGGDLLAPDAPVTQIGGVVRGNVFVDTYTTNASSINPTPCSAQGTPVEVILVFMGTAERPGGTNNDEAAPPHRRRQARNPYCVPEDHLIVPSHGAIRPGDTVTINGAEVAEVAELLYIGASMEAAFRFTTNLTGNYPSRTGTVAATVPPSVNPGAPSITMHPGWCPFTPTTGATGTSATATGTPSSSSSGSSGEISSAPAGAAVSTALAVIAMAALADRE